MRRILFFGKDLQFSDRLSLIAIAPVAMLQNRHRQCVHAVAFNTRRTPHSSPCHKNGISNNAFPLVTLVREYLN